MREVPASVGQPGSSLFAKFRDLAKEGAIYGTGSMAQRLAALVLLPLYTTVLSSAEYGILGLVLITGQIAEIVFALGLRASLFRSFYDYDDEKARRVVVSTVLILTAGSGLLLLFGGVVFADDLAALVLGDRQYASYFVLLTIITACSLFNETALALLRARHQPVKYAVLQLLFFLTKVALIVYFVAGRDWGVRGVLVGYVTAALVFAVVFFWFIRDSLLLGFSRSEARKMAGYGGPLVLVGLFGFVSTYVDRYVLKYYADLHEVGLYTLGYQLGMLMVVVLVTPSKLVWGPMFLSVKDDNNFKEFCAKALTYLMFVGGFVFLAVALLSKELLRIMADPEFWEAYTVVPIIAITYLLWGARTVLEVGVLLKRKTGAIAWYMFAGAAINVGLNFAWIPRHGMMGAAYATLVSFAVVITIDCVYNRKLYPIDYEWKRITKLGLTLAVAFATGYFYAVEGLYLSIAFKVGIILAYPFVLLLLGFYQPEEITALRRAARGLATSLRRRHPR